MFFILEEVRHFPRNCKSIVIGLYNNLNISNIKLLKLCKAKM